MQRAACRNLCFAVTHVFKAIYALDDWEEMLHRLPVRLIPTVACLACDNMSPSDIAALGLVRLLSDSRLVGDMDAEDPIRVLRCPAMKHLVRRMLPLALATLQHADLQTVTDHLRAVHQELSDDELLSEHIRMSEMWHRSTPTSPPHNRYQRQSDSQQQQQLRPSDGRDVGSVSCPPCSRQLPAGVSGPAAEEEHHRATQERTCSPCFRRQRPHRPHPRHAAVPAADTGRDRISGKTVFPTARGPGS